MNFKSIAALVLVAATAPTVRGGPLAYAACQTGCNVLAVACYGAAGFTFGVTVVAGPPALIACNVGLGTCMATCATVALFAPTP
ncbi:hypothetical protein SERLA73DRAFT_79354 [Serpula lacrymans var. lacrymans S7.3]|uniref:Cysteine-rich protein n=2 Tax=Serpula lacrymans var. lacrymans TaxID=341189 RepID=F8QG45_SERL3|nr:uncharacterized protein SERLADRAFT_436263 [Serpula lacrymans var. lacrymans S7.9]EGN92793.1 hypothetical protein SERLA73DRAFT_79354 [Serpula lacrymans var. lacrymans S7.3]EGO26451.1 hypothetical protein SERLADRAFT_436263 [Serpula lacrymans var. lacrymans S7.9]